jgi:[lysine-biosynthesis-protein LysW]---L-2-aminoadipate ligase
VSDGVRLGLFYTIVRPEERSILEAAERRGLRVERLHDEAQTFGLEAPGDLPDVVLNRSVSHSRAVYAARFFEHYGVPTVNPSAVLELSGDKVLASIRFHAVGIPTPRTTVALTPDAALRALDEIGYPAVLKPPIGSWGRLMAKVESHREAEQILEHKVALASPQHSVFYIQEYVPKPGRDLRVLVVGEKVAAAMYRYSDDWRTNAARGGSTEALAPTPELRELSLKAARAVGGGVLAVDLMESPRGLVVHEVNPTPEFKALAAATQIDIADQILSYTVDQGRR